MEGYLSETLRPCQSREVDLTGIARKHVIFCRGNDNTALHRLHCNLTCMVILRCINKSPTLTCLQYNKHEFDSYLVGQKQIPDLSKILLGEDKAHISFNVWQKSVKP